MKEILTSSWFYLFIASAWCLFGMQRAIKNFVGRSAVYYTILTWSAVIYQIGILAFLIYLGVVAVWWIPLVCAGIALLLIGLIPSFLPDSIFGAMSIVATPILIVLAFILV